MVVKHHCNYSKVSHTTLIDACMVDLKVNKNKMEGYLQCMHLTCFFCQMISLAWKLEKKQGMHNISFSQIPFSMA